MPAFLEQFGGFGQIMPAQFGDKHFHLPGGRLAVLLGVDVTYSPQHEGHF